MQVISKNRQLHLLTQWVRSVMKQRHLTQQQLAERIGLSRSALSSKFTTGMTYNDVEKIAEVLHIEKPCLATATMETLKAELRELATSPDAADFGYRKKK